MRKCKRVVLGRPVCEGLKSGHPWVFRDKMGDRVSLSDGDWVKLVDPDGKIVGTGIYQSVGGVAVRVFRLGRAPLTVEWLKERVNRAIEQRADLPAETNAYRVINGESDGLPGIVVDVYAGVGVLQTYAPGLDALGRYVAGLVANRLDLKSVVWKSPSKRVGDTPVNRVLRGERPYVVRFGEGSLKLSADLVSGQKSGTYLDLRGLRRYLSNLDLRGRKVLNLFCYTGAAGLACAHAGAREVVNVDQAKPSLDFGRRYHDHQAMKWVEADIFDWSEKIARGEFDVIIVDPPSMASNKSQVPRALKTYHRLYTTLAAKLKPGGIMVACCCTSRISAREFQETVSAALRPWKRVAQLPMEIDHQPAFREADYLKILVFEKPVERLGRPPRGKRQRKPSKKKSRSTGGSKRP